MSKKISILVIIVISLLILWGLVKQINDALTISKRVDSSADEVAKLQEKNNKLHQKLTQVQRPDFIEEIARNKLNLARPNETVVVIPDYALNQVLNLDKKYVPEPVPNWEGWLRLFFH